ncbi:PRC-barrel domain-containing protein [Streptacidiphilus jiangxiensis]|uniref:PRC-barrel domain-containing protein n=1 Tax=Streptacidiphilus jiangxiensis TaxID=235985 RepID=A0A1H7H6V3_STRJI|nr:PRC-barrel domain-containing protein [Streptacidiphilus jiangxiensis]SEK46021.1 hypothetical protein SAMN05414137_102100 [Streptacidiphilus jiangxiensis]
MESSNWTYRQGTGYQSGMDLAGFEVEATDGRIGKVDKHDDETDARHILVDIGRWIFGRQALLPVGMILKVDPVDRVVYVDRSKDAIKNAPEYDRDRLDGTPDYYQQVSGYYFPGPL